jgi:hypothetical protein
MKQEYVSRRKEIKGKNQEVEIQAHTVLTMDMDQITKFIYRLDRPLGEGNV